MDSSSWSNRRFISGDQEVRFSDNGQLMYPGQQATALPERPVNMLLWRNDPDVPSLPPQFVPGLPLHRFHPVANRLPNTGDRIERNAWNAGMPAGFYSEKAPILGVGMTAGFGNYSEQTPIVGAARAEAPALVVIEEMKVYHEPPCCWLLFLIAGILMIAVGIANILISFDRHSFCYIWTGVFLFVFTIACGIHGGQYWERKWKNVVIIAFGFVTTIAVLASFYIVVVSFCHQSIEISQFTPDFYISIQLYRYNYYNVTPVISVNSDWSNNIWASFSLDAIGLILLAISLGVLTTTMFVIDRFFNSHFVINRMVDPFCEPCLFNPWSQSSLGQAMIVVGALVGGCQHGIGRQTSWFIENAPVWAGIIPIFSGIVAALALKYCGTRRRYLAWFAVLAEFLSLVTSIIAVVLTTLLLADNIKTLVIGGVMIVTSWGRGMVIVSSFLECLADLICIVNMFYSLTLLFRLLTCLCTEWYRLPDDRIHENDEKQTQLVIKEKGEGSITRTDQPSFGGQFPRKMDNVMYDPFRMGVNRSFNM